MIAKVAPLPGSWEEAMAWFGYLSATDVRNGLYGVLVVVIAALALIACAAAIRRIL